LPYGVAKGSKKKINVFEAMQYIMAAWQQITQQTIQNYFRKAGYKYQLNGNKMANDDDFGEDWEELCTAQKYDFHSYVTVDRDLATSGVLTVEELCETYGSTRSVEDKNKGDKNWTRYGAKFRRDLRSFRIINAFFYAHSVTDVDREHILGLEKSYFQLRQNSAKKQKIMYDFFVKISGVPD
jgi:hypothetical protein